VKKQRSIPRIEGDAEGLNRKMEPVSGKWYTEAEPDNEEQITAQNMKTVSAVVHQVY
jgi:hypothetical protein